MKEVSPPRSDRVTVAILGGGGAMGGLYGALLHKAGHRVSLVDVSKAAVDAINAGGLRLEGFDGSTELLKIPATTDPASVGPVTLVIVQVKGRHTEAAAASAKPLVGPNTAVITLQNGWGNAQRLQAALGSSHVVAGISLHSAGLIGPGHVKHSGVGYTTIGELDGTITKRIQAIADVLAVTGKVNVSDNILKDIWTKLALNCCCLAACAMLRFRSGLMLELRSATELMKATTREVVAVANAAGVPLDYDATWTHIEHVVGGAKQVRCSMLQDVENGRLTEIETINGALLATAAEHGVPVPINQTLVWLIRAHDENVVKAATVPAP